MWAPWLDDWIAEGRKRGATHVVRMLDVFEWRGQLPDNIDYPDYPLYVMPGQTPAEVVAAHEGPPDPKRKMRDRAVGVITIPYDDDTNRSGGGHGR
jgi:hypothetical protein